MMTRDIAFYENIILGDFVAVVHHQHTDIGDHRFHSGFIIDDLRSQSLCLDCHFMELSLTVSEASYIDDLL